MPSCKLSARTTVETRSSRTFIIDTRLTSFIAFGTNYVFITMNCQLGQKCRVSNSTIDCFFLQTYSRKLLLNFKLKIISLTPYRILLLDLKSFPMKNSKKSSKLLQALESLRLKSIRCLSLTLHVLDMRKIRQFRALMEIIFKLHRDMSTHVAEMQ